VTKEDRIVKPHPDENYHHLGTVIECVWFQLAAELPARLWPACPASTSRSRAPGGTSMPGAGQQGLGKVIC